MFCFYLHTATLNLSSTTLLTASVKTYIIFTYWEQIVFSLMLRFNVRIWKLQSQQVPKTLRSEIGLGSQAAYGTKIWNSQIIPVKYWVSVRCVQMYQGLKSVMFNWSISFSYLQLICKSLSQATDSNQNLQCLNSSASLFALCLVLCVPRHLEKTTRKPKSKENNYIACFENLHLCRLAGVLQ